MACLVIFVSQTVSGKTHDKKMAGTMYSFPVSCTLYQDTGYQGYEPEGVEIIQPVKKPKGKELSRQDKEYNKKVSAIRVRIEHAIGSAKVMHRQRRVQAQGKQLCRKHLFHIYGTA